MCTITKSYHNNCYNIAGLITWLVLCLLSFQLGYSQVEPSVSVLSYPVEYKKNGKTIKEAMSRQSISKSEALRKGEIDRLEFPDTKLCVRSSQIHGVALHTLPGKFFAEGDTVAFAFTKVSSTGVFGVDYIETQFGAFVNNCESPNVSVAKAEHGLVMIAIKKILPNTEICASYRQFGKLFPGDETLYYLVPGSR
jgi:hypothetical protein